MSADAIVLAALSLDGLSYGDTSTRDRYMEALYPHDAPAQRPSMAAVHSSCGLTCEAVLRIAEVDGNLTWKGLSQDWLRTPYVDRQKVNLYAIALQVQLAKSRLTWVAAGQGQEWPEPGDMVLVGHVSDPSFGGGEHVLTVIEVKNSFLTSVDGGQTDPGNGGRPTAIRAVKRELTVKNGSLFLGSRKVVGWVKGGSLPCLKK